VTRHILLPPPDKKEDHRDDAIGAPGMQPLYAENPCSSSPPAPLLPRTSLPAPFISSFFPQLPGQPNLSQDRNRNFAVPEKSNHAAE